MKNDPSLRSDEQHFAECHTRWMERRNRKMEASDYELPWAEEQCGMCRYWIPLEGIFATDYGACSNQRSPFDGFVRFEHDGCNVFSSANAWVTPSSDV
jgi:hypothetical protein